MFNIRILTATLAVSGAVFPAAVLAVPLATGTDSRANYC